MATGASRKVFVGLVEDRSTDFVEKHPCELTAHTEAILSSSARVPSMDPGALGH